MPLIQIAIVVVGFTALIALLLLSLDFLDRWKEKRKK